MLLHRLSRRGLSILAICFVTAFASNVSAAHIPGTSSLAGWVYIDKNNDGNLAFSNEPNPEWVIGDSLISLFSKVGNVETFVSSTLSDPYGRYGFENITPGTYVLRQTQSVEYVDGKDTLGILFNYNGGAVPPGNSPGVASNNTFSDITLTADVGGDYYNFGERGLSAGYASKRFLLGSAPGSNTAIPEPGSIVLLMMAVCVGSGLLRRR